jgi:hypothetical protein
MFDALPADSALDFQDSRHMEGISELLVMCIKTADALLRVATTQLQMCRHTRLRLEISAPEIVGRLSLSLDDSKDDFGIGLRMFLVFYSNVTEAGTPCPVLADDDCIGFSRRVVLFPETSLKEWSLATPLSFVGTIIADPSAAHYTIVVEVRTFLKQHVLVPTRWTCTGFSRL